VHTVDRELMKIPIFANKATELKEEQRDNKYIAAHQGKIAAHEMEVLNELNMIWSIGIE